MKVVILIFLFITTPLFGGVVRNGLHQIPEHEICLMRSFAKTNFKWNQISYTLFFTTKACSLASAFYKSPEQTFENQLWIRGWEVFKKHDHLFPHPNFIFAPRLYEEDENGYQTLDLFIINKRALAKCLEQNKAIFQSVIGAQCCFEWFISELENEKTIEEITNQNQVLLGILLGYGAQSAKAFNNHQIQRLGHYFLREDVYCGNSPEAPKNCDCFPIVFMGNPKSKEVQNLMKIYQKEFETFWDIYQKKDPLILFLEAICEDREHPLEDTFNARQGSTIEYSSKGMLNPFY